MKTKAIALFLLGFIPAFAQDISQPAPEKNLVRLSKITVDPAQLERYNAFLKEEIEASMRLEPGVLTLYAVSEKEHPNKVTILEIYADQDAYKNHIQTPHFQKYKQGTLQMVQELEFLFNRRALGASGKHGVQIHHVGSGELALPDQLGCMAKAGNAVLARMQAHARHGCRKRRFICRAIQSILEERRDHAILLIQIDGKARGRQQQRILAKARRGINRPWLLDAFCARSLYQQLLLQTAPLEPRQHAGKIGTQLHRAVGEREALGLPDQLKPRGPSNRKGIDDAHGHSLINKRIRGAPFMPAPNRPLLSHMRHGPQHPNAKHRHQPRTHGSDHRIAHAPSQRPRLSYLLCSVHHDSSLRPAPCYGLIIAAPHMSCYRFGLRPAFLFERLDRAGKRRFQTHASLR